MLISPHQFKRRPNLLAGADCIAYVLDSTAKATFGSDFTIIVVCCCCLLLLLIYTISYSAISLLSDEAAQHIRELLPQLMRPGYPLLIFANKQDLPYSASVAESKCSSPPPPLGTFLP